MAKGHAVHAVAHTTHLELAKAVLEELEVPLALAHLSIELGDDGLVGGLLPHDAGGLQQGLLSLDLFRDVHDLVVVVHDGGIVVPARRGAQERRGRRVDDGWRGARHRPGRGSRACRLGEGRRGCGGGDDDNTNCLGKEGCVCVGLAGVGVWRVGEKEVSSEPNYGGVCVFRIRQQSRSWRVAAGHMSPDMEASASLRGT